jgi:DNA processing protein
MNIISSVTEKVLALSALKGIGPVALRKMSAVPDFESASIDVLASRFSQIDKALSHDRAWSEAMEFAQHQVHEASVHGARILSANDAEYPPLLSKTKDDPFIVFVKGTLASSPQHSVAIIGTREPTKHGGMIAARVTRFFAEQGWSVVSGLALGCDAVAHKSAIGVGGHTVAVLAHGLQMVSPASNRGLADEILKSGGALVSEYAFGVKAQPQFFVKRDRTQAGMAQGVVMVQSDIKGGSLHASRAALDYRRWLAVPYPTIEDIANSEPKIQANLVMSDGDVMQKLELLRCSSSELQNLIIIRGKEDYLSLVGRDASVGEGLC